MLLSVSSKLIDDISVKFDNVSYGISVFDRPDALKFDLIRNINGKWIRIDFEYHSGLPQNKFIVSSHLGNLVYLGRSAKSKRVERIDLRYNLADVVSCCCQVLDTTAEIPITSPDGILPTLSALHISALLRKYSQNVRSYCKHLIDQT